MVSSDKGRNTVSKLEAWSLRLWLLSTIYIASTIENPTEKHIHEEQLDRNISNQAAISSIAPKDAWTKFGPYMGFLYSNNSEETKETQYGRSRLSDLTDRFEQYQHQYNRQNNPYQECIPLRELWKLSVGSSSRAKQAKKRGETKQQGDTDDEQDIVNPKDLLSEEQFAHLFFFYYLINSETFKKLGEEVLDSDLIVCMSNDHNFTSTGDNKGFYDKRLNVMAYELKDSRHFFDEAARYQNYWSSFVKISDIVTEELAHAHQFQSGDTIVSIEDRAFGYDRKLVDHFVEGQAKFTKAIVLAEMAILDEGYEGIVGDARYTKYNVARSLYDISQTSGVSVSEISPDLLSPLYEEVLWDEDFIHRYHDKSLGYMNAYLGGAYDEHKLSDYIGAFGTIPHIEGNLLETEYGNNDISYVIEKLPDDSGLKAWFKAAIKAKAAGRLMPRLEADPDKTDYSYITPTSSYPST